MENQEINNIIKEYRRKLIEEIGIPEKLVNKIIQSLRPAIFEIIQLKKKNPELKEND